MDLSPQIVEETPRRRFRTRGGRSGATGNIAAMDASDQNSDTGHVPVFGTWRRIYVSVIVVNLIAMTAVYVFSKFPY